jgi:hypothetical protein
VLTDTSTALGADGVDASLAGGVMDALGVDDSRFVVTYEMGEPIKGGEVQVEISA